MQYFDRNPLTNGATLRRCRVPLSATLATLSIGVALCTSSPAVYAQATVPGPVGGGPIVISPPGTVGSPVAGGPVSSTPFYTTGEIQAGKNMHTSPEAARELAFILRDRAARTPAQMKMGTNLRYAANVAKGLPVVVGAPKLKPSVTVLSDGTINCDIKVPSTNTTALVKAIQSAGGTVVGVSTWSKKIRAFLPVLQIETLAGRSDVTFIAPAIVPKPMNSRQHPLAQEKFVGVPYRTVTHPADRKPKTAAERLAASLASLPNTPLTLPLFPSLTQAVLGSKFDKEGYYGHQIDVASASPYNMTGAGIKIGVISTDVEYLAMVQKDGYLGAVTVVANNNTDGEGTAMLQIVHDIAPDAQLFFATGETGLFADYIVALRDTYGCDIILDDLGEGQPAFSEGDVAQAVNHVTSEGALYFSSAGNQGNNQHYDLNRRGKNVLHHDGECWEGDFVSGGAAVDPNSGVAAQIHLFTSLYDNATGAVGTADNPLQSPYNTCINGTTNGQAAVLQWSDPYGADEPFNGIGSDYIIFTVDANGNIDGAGADDYGTPYTACEAMDGDIVFAALLSGTPCALRVDRTQDGELGDNDTLEFTTPGESDAHNAGRNTLGVAAIDAAGTTSAFTAANNTIYFSSDGPRRLFFTADSAGNQIPVIKGVQTFADNGYLTLLKPDVTAANGVTTDTPGFAPFYGTSAASPHAGAIAGLVLSYGTAASPKTVTVTTGTGASATTYGTTTIIGRTLAPADMKTVLESSAIDNNAGLNVSATSSYDYTGGFGIVMPVLAAQYLQKFFDPTTVGVATVNASNYKVTWTTNLPASSIVHYGTSPTALNLIARGSQTPTTNHMVQVPNVSATTPVYYTIETATSTGSVSFVGSAPVQLNTGTTPAPTQKSNVVLANLALIRLATGQIQATVTMSNTGPGVSGTVSLTATLGVITGTPAPASLGTIASGKTAKAVFVFPTVPAGTQTQFVLSGTEGNNTIATTTQVQVP